MNVHSQVEAEAALPSAVSATRSELVAQAYEEFCRHRETAEDFDPDAFCGRFGSLQSSLSRCIHAHLFFEENLHLLKPPPSRWPEVGETFLGYELVHELGKGSFARVFLAREPRLGNRLVAVKVSRYGASEAEILGRLKHANIVPVYSVQHDAGSRLSAVCMPYLGSATLCDVLDRVLGAGALPRRAQLILDAVADPGQPAVEDQPPSPFLRRATYVDGVCALAAQLADALDFIHKRGICHRDLKPSNILMSPSGTPLLLDFNLSADVAEQTARLGGTIPYMSPEQLLATDRERPGQSTLLDGRADLFSLGVILFELLAGHHPFGPLALKLSTDEMRKLLFDRQRQGPLSLRHANPDVDKPLARLVERCLAYNPNDRPRSAAAVAAALRKRLTPWRRMVRWMRGHPRTMVAAVVLCAALTLGALALWSLRDPYPVRQFNQGVAMYERGHYAQAVKHFHEVLEHDPTATPALFARARAFQKLAETDSHYLTQAIADYQAADARSPNPRIKACLGYCFTRQRLAALAIAAYERAVQDGWTSAALCNNLGYAYSQAGRIPDAKRLLDQAIALDPGLQVAYHNRAVVAIQKVQSVLFLFESVRAQADTHDGKARDEAIRCVLAGIKDCQQAMSLGPKTARLYYDAASLCGIAARHDNAWLATGLDYVTEAVKHGFDPQQLAGDGFLAPLRTEPGFQLLLLRRCPAGAPAPPVRLVDPVAGITLNCR